VTAFVRICLVAVLIGAAVSEIARAQWGPIPTTPGTTLTYRTQARTFVDSIATIRGDTMIVRRAVLQSGRVVASYERRLVRRPSGIEQVDPSGNLLLFPVPWPTIRRWSYSSAGILYRHTILGDTTWTVRESRVKAWIVQVTAEGNGRSQIFRVIAADGVGLASQQSVPRTSPDDFSLVSVSLPSRSLTTVQSRPRTANSGVGLRPLKWLVPSPYGGLFAAAGTHGTDEPQQGSAFRDNYYLAGGAEIGLHHYLGVRARILRVVPRDENDESLPGFGLTTLDVIASSKRRNDEFSVYFGLGFTRHAIDSASKWLGSPNSATMGIRNGGERVGWYAECVYFRRAFPKPVSSGISQRGDFLAIVAGIRVF
jgi:hypothetical protein